MRPKTNSSTPHTINDVVDDPVDGMVPAEVVVVPVGLPPVAEDDPVPLLVPVPAGVAAVTIVNVTVRWALTVPVMVTV